MWKEMEVGGGSGGGQIAEGTVTFSSSSNQQTIQTGLTKIGTFILYRESSPTSLVVWDSKINLGTNTVNPNRYIETHDAAGAFGARAVGTAYAYSPALVSKPTNGDITLFAPTYSSYYTNTYNWRAYEETE